MAEHKGGGDYGKTHDRDCPACVADAAERDARHAEMNPHRPGTKAHARREAEDRAASRACDPRYEAFWAM